MPTDFGKKQKNVLTVFQEEESKIQKSHEKQLSPIDENRDEEKQLSGQAGEKSSAISIGISQGLNSYRVCESENNSLEDRANDEELLAEQQNEKKKNKR